MIRHLPLDCNIGLRSRPATGGDGETRHGGGHESPPVQQLVPATAGSSHMFVPWWEDPATLEEYQVNYRKVCGRRGHQYFHDPEREAWARAIAGAFRRDPVIDIWFCTFTFRTLPDRRITAQPKRGCRYKPGSGYVSPASAERRLLQFIGRLEQSLSQQSGEHTRVRWVRADEDQQRGVIHYHALVHGDGLRFLSRRRWEEKWFRMAGLCRILPFYPRSAPYLAKYVSKGSCVTFGGDWSGRTIPLQKQCCRSAVSVCEAGTRH